MHQFYSCWTVPNCVHPTVLVVQNLSFHSFCVYRNFAKNADRWTNLANVSRSIGSGNLFWQRLSRHSINNCHLRSFITVCYLFSIRLVCWYRLHVLFALSSRLITSGPSSGWRIHCHCSGRPMCKWWRAVPSACLFQWMHPLDSAKRFGNRPPLIGCI